MKQQLLKHGVVRGMQQVPSSTLFEGKFGRMFRTLPPAPFEMQDLQDLAKEMIAEEDDGTTLQDPEENSGISAGYTYLGQFIDHDITFDPASSLQQNNDPNALVDFRTPRFDLDNVYGRGPDDQPYLYDNEGLKFLLGKALTGNPHDPHTRDLQRNNPPTGPKRALIGDPRNDENVIVSQLQGIFLRFHNRIVDVRKQKGLDARFETIQKLVRWHYQWVVLNDFLPTIIGKDMVDSILPHLKKNTTVMIDKPLRKFYNWEHEPFIPVEFSVAAYRFGHSMVRPQYQLNTGLTKRLKIFPDLTGFDEFDASLGIDWTLFFDFGNHPDPNSINRIQPAYKIDTSLVNPLGSLPPNVASQIPSLAERNLLRGWRMSLPSGQDVARAMGLPVIPDNQLKVGKATKEDSPNNRLLTDISPAFIDNAPLWYYILAEAQQEFNGNDQTPIRLGPVGGRIVGEVFAGLLVGDSHSFLNQAPYWKPMSEFVNSKGGFGIVELIRQAQQA